MVTEFSYGSAVDRVANLCKIPASNYDLQAGSRSGLFPAARNARMRRLKLSNVSIAQAAKFLYTIQSMWPLLTCESTNVTKQKGMPDQWNVDFRFLYYY